MAAGADSRGRDGRPRVDDAQFETTLCGRTRRYRIFVSSRKGQPFRFVEYTAWAREQWALFSEHLNLPDTPGMAPKMALWVLLGLDEAEVALDNRLEGQFGCASETDLDPLVGWGRRRLRGPSGDVLRVLPTPRTATQTVRALLHRRRPKSWRTLAPRIIDVGEWDVFVGDTRYTTLRPRSGPGWYWNLPGRGSKGWTHADTLDAAMDEIADSIARRLLRKEPDAPACLVCGLPMAGVAENPGCWSKCVDLEGGRDEVSLRIPGCGYELRR
jgi:hypothetical protein